MAKNKANDFGLEITNNSKAGPAFSLPRSKTCIYKTDTCWRVCYGKGIRYQAPTQKAKRERNFRTCEFLLDAGGPQLLAENLTILIDQVRPIDWIASRIAGELTDVPWTFRIHDVGDFYSARYVEAWIEAVQKRPECSFWFYTRSFVDSELFKKLTALAGQPNCKGWLSVDSDNYSEGILAYSSAEARKWNLALLQEEEGRMPPDMVPAILTAGRPGEIVAFPKHHGGRHAPAVKADNLVICPQVLGAYPLQPNKSMQRPCQTCSFCLPVTTI